MNGALAVVWGDVAELSRMKSRMNIMLVLSRRIGEEIVVDKRISIRVISVKGGTVRLGIQAPAAVTIDRKEVHDRHAEFAESELVETFGANE